MELAAEPDCVSDWTVRWGIHKTPSGLRVRKTVGRSTVQNCIGSAMKTPSYDEVDTASKQHQKCISTDA